MLPLELQSEYRRVARRRWRQLPLTIPKVKPKFFRLIKLLMFKLNVYFRANQRNCLKNLSYFSFQSNLIKEVWFTNCS